MNVPCVGGPFDGERFPYDGNPTLVLYVDPPEGRLERSYCCPGHAFGRDGQAYYRIQKIYLGGTDCFDVYWLHDSIPKEEGTRHLISGYRQPV